MRKLDGLKWRGSWVTHLECVRACLDFLEIDVTDAWLWGGTGHAFVINIHEVVCPSGPTAWKAGAIHRQGENVGYIAEGVGGFKHRADFRDKQERAWNMLRKAMDEGFPCFGWELDIPEFYLIHGYDGTGYYYKGCTCEDGAGPLPWEKLGDTGIGVVEAYAVRPGTPADDARTVRDALQFALDYPLEWLHDGYSGGPAGYDTWITAIAEGKADGFGTAYNAAVWSECRHLAAGFLREAKQRLPEHASLFDQAIPQFETVSQNLSAVSKLFPFLGASDGEKAANVKDGARCEDATGHLEAARDAEAAGLKVLADLVADLG